MHRCCVGTLQVHARIFLYCLCPLASYGCHHSQTSFYAEEDRPSAAAADSILSSSQGLQSLSHGKTAGNGALASKPRLVSTDQYAQVVPLVQAQLFAGAVAGLRETPVRQAARYFSHFVTSIRQMAAEYYSRGILPQESQTTQDIRPQRQRRQTCARADTARLCQKGCFQCGAKSRAKGLQRFRSQYAQIARLKQILVR